MKYLAIKTSGRPEYPRERFQRVAAIGLETQEVVAALPALGIRPADPGGGAA